MAFLETAQRMNPNLLGSLAVLSDDSDSALTRWAARFNLSDAWVVETARATLRTWSATGLDGQLVWTEIPAIEEVVLSRDERRIRLPDLSDLTYNPQTDSRSEFRERLLTDLAAFLDGEMNRIDEAFTEHRPDPPKLKRQSQHFEWAVLFQIGEAPSGPWDYGSIAARYPPAKPKWEGARTPSQTISKGVKTTAETLGLTLRETRRGRRSRD